jgi:hypothetical protein
MTSSFGIPRDIGISFEKRCTRPRNLGSQSVAGGPAVISDLHYNGLWRSTTVELKHSH